MEGRFWEVFLEERPFNQDKRMTKISCKYRMRSSGLRDEVCGAMEKGDLGAFLFLYKEFSLVGRG